MRLLVIFALIASGMLSPAVYAADEGAAETQADKELQEDALLESANTVAETSPELPLPSVSSIPTPLALDAIEVPSGLSTERAPLITEVQVSGRCTLETPKKCSSTNSAEFIELFNPNDTEISLGGYELSFQNRSGTKTVIVKFDSSQKLEPNQFGLIVRDFESSDVLVLGTISINNGLIDGSGAVFLEYANDDSSRDVVDQVAWGDMALGFYGNDAVVAPGTDKSLQRCFAQGHLQTFEPRNTLQEFVLYAGENPTPGVGIGCVVPEEPVPVNTCDGVRINEIAANVQDQFVELKNDTDHAISLDGCQLQTNRSTTRSFVFGAEALQAGAIRTIHMDDTLLTLTKTTSGIVYVLSSDGLSETDSQAYSNLANNTSWARSNDDSWAQTYAITLDAENNIQKYLPCDDGYERNVNTGRCNKITIVITIPDCGEGKYRSEDTGRCRSIPVASILTACKLGQYRSEETNRCRNIVAASVQKPCKNNQYRSEETSRCRNLPVASVPDATFAVQSVKDTGTAFVGWWALGGVSLLAVGYGVWEWRDEVRQLVGRITSRFSASK